MPLTFVPVPDWTSSEKQGTNMAVADLYKDGDRLFVLAIL
jgi:hypothetical protein